MTLVIGIGGNLGDEAARIRRFGDARAALAELGAVRSARLYRSAPIGPDQPAFLNSALAIAVTDVQPGELIATLLELERLLGRQREREARWGPRTIDLDVLVWGERRLATPELEVPHPRLAERRFALAPLLDLVGGGFVVPGRGPAGVLLAAVRDQACEEIAERW